MTTYAKAPAPVLVDLPCGTSSAWHSGTHVFPPEQHRRTPSLSAHQAQKSTRRQRRRTNCDQTYGFRGAAPRAHLCPAGTSQIYRQRGQSKALKFSTQDRTGQVSSFDRGTRSEMFLDAGSSGVSRFGRYVNEAQMEIIVRDTWVLG